MTVLMVIAILAAAASCVATIFVSTLPKNALTVRVTNHAEFRINEKNFDSLWDILADGFSCAGDVSPEAMLSGGNNKGNTAQKRCGIKASVVKYRHG